MLSNLHDRIDKFEAVADEAAQATARVRSKVKEVAKGSSDMHELMAELAAQLADEMAPITTAAVRTGFDIANNRFKK